MTIEQRCTDLGSGCVMSEKFQDTSYTTVASGGNFICVLGDDPNTKPGLLNHPASVTASNSHHDGLANGTFSASFDISTDSAILSLLPNRDVSAVARFLKSKDTFNGGVYRFGYSPISLGTTVKRIALRWYSYHTPTYDFAFENACTNGKIVHSSQASWGAYPLFTFQSYGAETNEYSFTDAGSWVWTGHASFDGIVGGHGTHPGAAFNLANWRGKWFRHEIIVRRPRNADSQAGGLGFDFQFFTKNVTDNTAEVEDTRFSAGCTGCIWDGGVPGSTFVWNTGTYPTADMSALHTEFYRAGTCAGWQGWLYAMVAKWDTDNGDERIGAASEIEGGGGAIAFDSGGRRGGRMIGLVPQGYR
jgi:hypothetical protein